MTSPSPLDERVLTLINSSNGKDKLLKACQFGAKIVNHYYLQPSDGRRYEQVKQLGGAITQARKLPRFGQESVHLRAFLLRANRLLKYAVLLLARASGNASSRQLATLNSCECSADDVFACLKSLCLFIFHALDHKCWLHYTGAWRGFDKLPVFQRSQQALMCAVLCQAASDTLVRGRPLSSPANIVPALDIVTSAALGGVISISDGAVGIAGTLSSLLVLAKSFK